MSRRVRVWACLLFLTGPSFAADVYIGVSGGGVQSTFSVGLAPFLPQRAGNKEDSDLGVKARETVRQDLLFSRRFLIVSPPSGPAASDPKLHSQEWKRKGAGFVLSATAIDISSKTVITASLLDLSSGDVLFQRPYHADSRSWRSAVHKLSDDVVRQLTGHPGIAHTQIAFTNNATGFKELYLIDSDGENLRQMTRDRSIDLLPRWSPDSATILYTSYKHGNPDLYAYSVNSESSRVFLDRQGLDLAGGFSPDGSKLALTLSLGTNPNIFIYSFQGGDLEHLTHHFGVDASPTFSPDGDQIAFVSDRSGNPQVHILELSSGRIQRLTRLNWCDSPSWSPNGDWIVFAGRAHSLDPMDIFLVDVTGSQIRQITHGEGSNEDPSWSPDGRFIAFTTTRNRRRQLFVMDADGSAPHPLANIPGNSFTPSWSP